MTLLDRLYNLNYNAPLKRDDFKCYPDDRDHKDLQLVEVLEAFDEFSFRLKGVEGTKKWGRERFKILPSVQKKEKDKAAPLLAIEAVVLKPRWYLDPNPREAINFQQAEAGTVSIDKN